MFGMFFDRYFIYFQSYVTVKKLTIIFFVIMLSLFACKKKSVPSAPVPPTEVDAGLRKGFFYKPGTYWIYKDSLNNEIDSFAVVGVDSEITGIARGYKGSDVVSYKNIKIHEQEFNVTGGIEAFIKTWNWQLMNNSAYLDVFMMLNYEDRFFVYPIDSGYEIGGNDNDGRVVNVFPAYIVAGNNYQHVALINHKRRYISYDHWFYVTNGEGIIKMSLKNYTTDANYNLDSVFHIWELQRYHIVR